MFFVIIYATIHQRKNYNIKLKKNIYKKRMKIGLIKKALSSERRFLGRYLG